MRDLFFYIDRAMKRGCFSSERKLCEALEISHNGITHYRRGSFPTDETMIRLAEIAGVDPNIALLDLNMWRTTGPAHAAYNQILNKIWVGAIALMLALAPVQANAAIAGSSMKKAYVTSQNATIYIITSLANGLLPKILFAIKRFFKNILYNQMAGWAVSC